jgi:hypothetical protein
LGISRTQLSKAEKYHRGMPYKTISPSIKMEQCLMDKEGLEQLAAGIRQQHQQEQLPQLLDKQDKQHAYAIRALERKLLKMEAQYQQCVKALANVTKLQQLPNLSEGQTISLNLIEARLQVSCCSCGPGAQALAQLKLQGLKAMQAALAQFLQAPSRTN